MYGMTSRSTDNLFSSVRDIDDTVYKLCSFITAWSHFSEDKPIFCGFLSDKGVPYLGNSKGQFGKITKARLTVTHG